jgi:ABC-type uncharacterized transport system permease subunit
MELILKILAALSFLGAALFTHRAWTARSTRQDHWSRLGLMGAGFALLTGALVIQGNELGRCPITNLPQVLIFLSWSMVLLYLVIGPVYRISLLGAFSAPMAFLLLVIGLILPEPTGPLKEMPAGPARTWLEFHAAISLIAYGAFTLAAVAGLMYLIQDRQIKSRRPQSVFYNLPPVETLLTATRRLMITGLILLGLGIGAGFLIGSGFYDALKISIIFGVWLLYALIVGLSWWSSLGARKFATLSLIALSVTLCSLVGMHWWA